MQMVEVGVPECTRKQSKRQRGWKRGRTTLNLSKHVHGAMPVWSAVPLRPGRARNQQDSAWGDSGLVFLQQRRCDWAGEPGQ